MKAVLRDSTRRSVYHRFSSAAFSARSFLASGGARRSWRAPTAGRPAHIGKWLSVVI